MSYDITDDDLPPQVIEGLKAKSWQWDASAQAWRLHNDAGNFSPNPLDHVRQFEKDVDAVLLALSSAENPGDQMKSPQVQESDILLIEAAKTLFMADAVKTGYVKPWDEAPEGMRAHFIRMAVPKT